ncbi:uncharacterized protein [Melanerpes formicivorus]|uniref:uncharacterized protein n=1 Tax=Melanerpes formicivorus TaxID=211600 RepID=UPI00358E8F3D
MSVHRNGSLMSAMGGFNPTQAVRAVPVWFECRSTQTELLHQHAGVQAASCRECFSLALGIEGEGEDTCVRCEQVNFLLSMVAELKDEVAELKEEVARLRTIRESERELDLWEKALQISPAEGRVPGNGEGWIQVPARGGKGNPSWPSPPLPLPLQNKYEALQAEGSGGEKAEEQPSRGEPKPKLSPPAITTSSRKEPKPRRSPPAITTSSRKEPKAKRSPPATTTSSTKKRRRVIVVGDSLLGATEGPICCPDPSHREVCSLPGAWVRDIARRLPKLIQPSDYHPLLVIQAGSDEIDRKGTRAIKKEFRALGQLIDGAGAQVVFCSVPSVAGEYTERNGRTHTINNWLRGWCQQQNFGFFDQGTFTALNLLGPDGVQLSRRGKRVLALELAGLIRRALN